MEAAWIGALVYLLAGAVFYVLLAGAVFYMGLGADSTERSLWARIALALFWPLTLVGLILWSFFGGEDADL